VVGSSGTFGTANWKKKYYLWKKGQMKNLDDLAGVEASGPSVGTLQPSTINNAGNARTSKTRKSGLYQDRCGRSRESMVKRYRPQQGRAPAWGVGAWTAGRPGRRGEGTRCLRKKIVISINTSIRSC
jgi:hypothetical protein